MSTNIEPVVAQDEKSKFFIFLPKVDVSAAQIYPNQNIRVIRVSPIHVYAYAYMHL